MKTLVTGGYGLIGSAIFSLNPDIIRFHKSEFDLAKLSDVKLLFRNYEPDVVIHLAAKVGGLGANMRYKGQFYTENMLINTNVLLAAKEFGVKKLLSVMSACVYPDKVTYPITEDQLHNGPPHNSNFGFAIAKRCLDVQSRCYREEYGCNFITVIPCNIFGEHDNFHYQDSHVLPAIIRKAYEAKKENKGCMETWGTGKPLREFIYSKDVAQMILYLIENYNSPQAVNLGYANQEMSILDATTKICEIMNYTGEIIWDHSKPDGQYRKPINCDALIQTGWNNKNLIGLDQGLINTCQWFEETYPNIRGIND